MWDRCWYQNKLEVPHIDFLAATLGTALAAAFWTLYIINSNKKLHVGHYVSIILLWVITIAVMKQRMDCKCHNIYQVTTGMVLGLVLGIGGYYLCNKLAPNTYPLKK